MHSQDLRRQAGDNSRYLGTCERLLDRLTPSEERVLALLMAGLSNKEIANQASVSVNTVKYHLKNIYAKIGATCRLHAVRRAREMGLI